MRNFHDFIQKLPNIVLAPFKNWIKQNLVLAVYTSYLRLLGVAELVLIEVLYLLADTLLLPILKLIHVSRKLMPRHLDFVALGTPYGFGFTNARTDNFALSAFFLEVGATPANLHRRQHLHPSKYVENRFVNLRKLNFGVIFTNKTYVLRRVNTRRRKISVHRNIAHLHHVIQCLAILASTEPHEEPFVGVVSQCERHGFEDYIPCMLHLFAESWRRFRQCLLKRNVYFHFKENASRTMPPLQDMHETQKKYLLIGM